LPFARVTLAVTFDPLTPIAIAFFDAVVARVVSPLMMVKPPVVIDSFVVVRASEGGPSTCTLMVRGLLTAVPTTAPV